MKNSPRAALPRTRVETLARKARVNKALLYYYFGSKLGLYKHIIHDGIDRFAARMREVAEARRPPRRRSRAGSRPWPRI